MTRLQNLVQAFQDGTLSPEDIADLLTMAASQGRRIEGHRARVGECHRQIDQLMAEREGWKQTLAANARIVKEAQEIISTSQPALALAGLLEDLEAAGTDVTVAVLQGVGAVIELQDTQTGDCIEYASAKLADAVTEARFDLMSQGAA